MTRSLTTLCAEAEGTVRFVVQPDRRQTVDRRGAIRGGRRGTDGRETEEAAQTDADERAEVVSGSVR